MKFLRVIISIFLVVAGTQSTLAQCTAPLGIDTTQMILWLCPDSDVFNSSGNPASIGETVFEWHDISGNNWVFENTINTNRPTLATVNGDTYLDFNGGDFLENIGIRDSINGLDEFSIFVVVKSRVTNTDKGFLYHTNPPDGADDLLCLRYDQTGANTGRSNVIKTGLLGNSANNQIETTANTQTTNRQVINITWQDGGRLYSYIDGVQNDSSNNTINGPIAGINELLIGKGAKDENTTESWDGYIGMIIFYKTQLSDEEIADISTVLPIELLAFDAKSIDGVVNLNWKTAWESTNDYFTVERSKDGIAFEEIDRIAGAGNSTTTLRYSATDESPYLGVSYYRLKQTDFDGKFEYSDLVTVYNSTIVSGEIKLYANPSDGNSFQLEIKGEKDREIYLKVYDTSGKVFHSETLLQESNFISKTVRLPNQLAPGTYFISGTDVAGEILFKKKLLVK